MLKITLAGVPGSGKAELKAALTKALQASDWQATITLNATAALAPSLASHDLILLMGLTADVSAARQAADQSIRDALADSGLPYQVLYGLNSECLGQAVRACEALRKADKPDPRTALSSPTQSIDKNQLKKPAWVWLCDTCSDPVCEHRLLTDLLDRRKAG